MAEKQILLSRLLEVVESEQMIRTVVLQQEEVIDETMATHAFYVLLVVNETFQAQIFFERLQRILMPNMMLFPPAKHESAYLLLAQDGQQLHVKSLTEQQAHQLLEYEEYLRVLIDKDQFLASTTSPCISAPTNEQFTMCCQQFWQGQQFALTSLQRQEHLPAIYYIEQKIRKPFMTMLLWSLSAQQSFSLTMSPMYNELEGILNAEQYAAFIEIFNLGTIENVQHSLQTMRAFFQEATFTVSHTCHLAYPADEHAFYKKFPHIK